VVTHCRLCEPGSRFAPTPSVDEQIDEAVNVRLNKTLLAYEDHRLAEKYPEFRNLSNEYREGLMLFEVSNQNVWNRPTQRPRRSGSIFPSQPREICHMGSSTLERLGGLRLNRLADAGGQQISR